MNLAYGFDPYEIGPLLVDKPRVYAEAAAIVVAAALLWFFRYTRTGAAIRACADNLTGAGVIGLNVRRLDALTFGLDLACVGAAGALLVTIADPAPTLGPAYTLLAFIIGGMGSVSGVLIGGVLIGLSEALAMAAVLLVAALVLHIEHRGFLLSCQPKFCSFIRQPRRG